MVNCSCWLCTLTAAPADRVRCGVPPAAFTVSCSSCAPWVALSITEATESALPRHSTYTRAAPEGSSALAEKRSVKQEMSKFLGTKLRLSGWGLADKSQFLCHEVASCSIKPNWSTSSTTEVLCIARCD